MWSRVAIISCALLGKALAQPAITQELVDRINALNTSWRASVEQGFGPDLSLKSVKALLGVLPGGPKLPTGPVSAPQQLPENFVASDKWGNCTTIHQIRDQSACGSCWAVAAAAAISDRYCTVLGADAKYLDVEISAGDLMSCCLTCGNGCNGGYPSAAWSYWDIHGLPTEQCDPYPFPRCEHHISGGKYPPCPSNEYPTPKCNRTCTSGGNPTYYHGKSSYSVTGEAAMMNELYNHGPFEVAFTVYQDFLTYKSGVYRHVTGNALGGHAVKIIGWGVSGATKYWVINNNWNEDWGNNGAFWILRGVDECGIESQGSAGLPAPF